MSDVDLNFADLDVDAQLALLHEQVAELHHALENLQGTGNPSTTSPTKWKYHNVYDWVEQWYCVVFAKRVGVGRPWCPMWWDHEEAHFILTALWRSWEAHRADRDKGMITWYTYYARPDIDSLQHELGTFYLCVNNNQHTKPKPLECTPTPDDLKER